MWGREITFLFGALELTFLVGGNIFVEGEGWAKRAATVHSNDFSIRVRITVKTSLHYLKDNPDALL